MFLFNPRSGSILLPQPKATTNFPIAVTLSERSESNGYKLYLTSQGKWNHPYITSPRLYPFDSNDSAFGFVISAQGDCLPLGCHFRDISTPGVGKSSPSAQGDCLPLECHCRDTSTLGIGKSPLYAQGDCLHLVLPLQKITMITHAIRIASKTKN